MKISTLQYRGYKARIVNISKSEDISDMVGECNIALPNSSVISVVEAKFTLDSKLIDDGNEVSIQVLDEVGNTIYSLQGKATITKRAKAYTEVEAWEYSIKDSYDKLFEKVVAEDMTFYDLYFCNTRDKNNSLLHIIARNLGFKDTDLDFRDLSYDNGELIRIPFVYLEENTRWIDNLQGFIDATNGILFVKNKKLIFRPRNLAINKALTLDRTNIITNIEEARKEVLQNGIKVVYDRYEKLENQVVFNISNKIIVDENTNKDTEVPTMRINYISSSVSQPTITKASGYYFTSDDVNTLTRIDLKKDVHYVIEKLSNTSCEVKFYNPLNYKLYIDNFEIKGIPLVAYEDNEVNVMFPTVVEKNQENFITESKRKLIQTQKQAIFLAKSKMRRNIVNSYEYNFNTYFLPALEIGSIYQLSLGDFENIVEIESVDISLKPSDFRMRVKAKGLKNEIGQTKISTKLAGNSNSNYIDLSNIEKSIEENAKEIEKVNERFKSISAEIQDSRVKIYTLKPNINTLTDENIGDMYITDKTAEILVKENNRLVWKPITDSSVRADLNEYIKSNDAKVIDIVYQNTEPENPKNGDIWIDTGNDGIWKRYTNNTWVQIDESIRTAIATANTNISEIEKKIKTINNTIDNKILAKAFVQEEQPTSGMKNHDIWYKPSDNTFKKWLNNRWNSATEDDIFPALRHYISLATAQLDIGKRIDGVDEKAGMFLTNNNTTFGAKNGTLAEVSLSKTGEILIKNANNLIQWNVKDPTSNKMQSRFLMGVQNVDTVPAGTYFKIGDEATGFSIELKDGSSVAKLDGQELGAKFGSINTKISEEQERATLIALMSTGKMLYTDPEFKSGVNGIVVYNLRTSNVVTHTRTLRQNTDPLYPPNLSGYTVNIRNAGTINADTVYPGAGGFAFKTQSRKEAVFITRIIARIPLGWKINFRTNPIGENAVEKWLTSQDGTGKYEEYIFYLKCGNSTNISDFGTTNWFYLTHRTNNYQAFTWYLAYATVFDCTANRDEYIFEVDKKITNADGRLTTLQQNYQNTVQDVTNFKTRTADRIDTVQGALDNGNFVINGNTTFADGVRFVSRGTNEVITIANGTIDFHRDGKKLTRIKNSRYGTIATDSKGKGVVNFDGFKQPMIVLTSIKSANFGKNMASVFCYAEHIRDCQYRMFVGGTNEHYTEAKPIKVVGTEWSSSNSMVSTLLEYTGSFNSQFISKVLSVNESHYEKEFLSNKYKNYNNKDIKVPTFNFKIIRIDGTSETILVNKNYTVTFTTKLYQNKIDININKIDLSTQVNILKKYTSRTNVKFKIVISITQSILEIERKDFSSKTSGGKKDDGTIYYIRCYRGSVFTLTQSHFTGLTITASAETSTLSDVTGTGEVQYIAMEID